MIHVTVYSSQTWNKKESWNDGRAKAREQFLQSSVLFSNRKHRGEKSESIDVKRFATNDGSYFEFNHSLYKLDIESSTEFDTKQNADDWNKYTYIVRNKLQDKLEGFHSTSHVAFPTSYNVMRQACAG